MTGPRIVIFKAASLVPRRVVHGLSVTKSRFRSRLATWRSKKLLADEFSSAQSEVITASADTTVLRVVPRVGAPVVVKVATSSAANDQLKREMAALDELAGWVASDRSLAGVALIVRRGNHRLGRWYAQTELVGRPASTVDAASETMVTAATQALEPFHARTRRMVTCDVGHFTGIAADPVAIVKRWRPEVAEGLDMIIEFLRDQLLDYTLVVSRLHGDFAPSNVLWDDTAHAVSGIVDWELGPALLPPEIDNLHFFVSLCTQERRVEYGEAVVWLLRDGRSSRGADTVARLLAQGPNSFSPRVGLVLMWLHHVATGLQKSVGYQRNPIWLTNNVDVAVAFLADELRR